MMSPVADTFDLGFDVYSDTPSFDIFASPGTRFDPNSYFDFDACVGGPDPDEAASTPQPTETNTTADGLQAAAGRPLVSESAPLSGDNQDSTGPTTSTVSPGQLMLTLPNKRQGPPTGACGSSPLVLPKIEPVKSEDDDVGTLLAELSCSMPDAFQLHTAAPTPVQDCDSLALPADLWPVDAVDPSFAWDAEVSAEGPGLFAPELQIDGICGTFNAFDPFHSFDASPDIKQDLTSSAGYCYPSPPATNVFFPTPQGEIPFVFDESSVDLPYSHPADVSLTGLQPLLPRAVTAVAAADASSTTELVQPKPRSPNNCVSFIQQRSESLMERTSSSILDYQGLVHVPVTSAPYLTPTHTPVRGLTTPVVDGKVLKRIPRPAKAKDVDASEWYEALPEAPMAWGGRDPKNPMFQYNKEGELLPSLRFSREQIFYYLKERKDQGLPLTLWIQNVPHGCKTRVSDDRLRACRWSGCPAHKGTILKGFWRVCFDERPGTSGKQHDPYHNAGYMHLWCLDRCFDLFEIDYAFDLKPDTRYFEKEERNPMAMTRDHDELVMEFEKWRTSQRAAYEEWQELCKINKALGLPIKNRLVEKEAKIWYMLTTRHLELETPVRSNMRKRRAGISIDKHKGDLGWYVEKVNEKKDAKKGGANPEEIDDDDEVALDNQVSRLRDSGQVKRKSEVREWDEVDDGDSDAQRQIACGRKRLRRSYRSGMGP
ncbi:uncharacterized protein GLRG_02146 [Colletotrichum graminicola M1.001]|uniref:Uncharacterized protein n=1 Tax=Colletotrichum graminicola (strain M1.001 / M2 / FGSC 10212) TaxID=645133 RepID=E3Q7W3_COLGM|nr:uncharacterized protein GLRG_02146 [Colletotrichum graminicola M1.001]EFQ26975.1 hypothetical protein GLRG_02146 [Colletotrichum graminicola M1.001]